MTATVDHFKEPTRAETIHPVRFLYRLNPLSKAFAVLPPTLWVIFTRELNTSLGLIALSLIILLIGSKMSYRFLLTVIIGLPALLGLLTLSFGLWADPSLTSDTVLLFPVGPIEFRYGNFVIGITTASRILSVIIMALISGLTTRGQDFVRALVQQLKVPYRVGYTVLTAQRFIPRFAYEFELIRAAHRVRGVSRGRGPFSAIRRTLSYLVPLLAGAIRHAERVALAMDSRAFGAYPSRTERFHVPWRMRDNVFIALFWGASIAIIIVANQLQLISI